MNHRPFEDWLLNEQPLNNEEKRELQLHAQACDRCAALAEVNLELRAVKMAAPAPGFTLRFQKRLARRRVIEARNRLVGLMILAFGGLGITAWFAAPYVTSFLGSPAEWIAAIFAFLLSLVSMFEALSDLSSILLRVLPDFIPPFAWLVFVSALSGFGLLWAVSIWRFSRLSARSVSA
ncbi:MAG: hypothetical protein AB1750_16420 [Chloroflexota bacterium]